MKQIVSCFKSFKLIKFTNKRIIPKELIFLFSFVTDSYHIFLFLCSYIYIDVYIFEDTVQSVSK